jgi:hypothetical protein
MMEIVPTYKTPEDVNLKFFEIKPDESSANGNGNENIKGVGELKEKKAVV